MIKSSALTTSMARFPTRSLRRRANSARLNARLFRMIKSIFHRPATSMTLNWVSVASASNAASSST